MSVRPIAALFMACLLVTGGAAGTAGAGDTPIVMYPETEEKTATPGDTLEFDVIVGHFDDPGLANITLAGEYDDSVVDSVDIELASWFETDETRGAIQTEIETDETGSVTATQRLDPPDSGVVTAERFATLTVTIAEDAPVGNTTIDLAASSVRFAGATISAQLAETSPEIVVTEDASGDDDDSTSSDTEATNSDGTGAFPLPPVILAVALGGLFFFGRAGFSRPE